VAVLTQQVFMTKGTILRELNSKHLFDITVSRKLTVSFFRFLLGYSEVTPHGLKPNTV